MRKGILNTILFILLGLMFLLPTFLSPMLINAYATEVKNFDVRVNCDKDSYKLGEDINYSISIKNNSGKKLTNVKITNKISDKLTILNSSETIRGNSILLERDVINKNETIVISVRANSKLNLNTNNNAVFNNTGNTNSGLISNDLNLSLEENTKEDVISEIVNNSEIEELVQGQVSLEGDKNTDIPKISEEISDKTNKTNLLVYILGGTLCLGAGTVTAVIIKKKVINKIISLLLVFTVTTVLILTNVNVANAATQKVLKEELEYSILIGTENIISKIIVEGSYSSSSDSNSDSENTDNDGIETINVNTNRHLNYVQLDWIDVGDCVYTVEKGETNNSMEIVLENESEPFYTDILESKDSSAFYRITAFKDGAIVGKSETISMKAELDTDGDGLSDIEEILHGTDINKSDTDGDGINDYIEIYTYKTNPLLKDTDGDNLTDAQEIICGTDPLSKDSDNNGITDDLEDLDGDSLNNVDEFVFGSDPKASDSDFDGLNDLREKELGTNPNNPDSDEDGLTDLKEIELGTDPLNSDSNGNGILDGDEEYTVTLSVAGDKVSPKIEIDLDGNIADTLTIEEVDSSDTFLNSDIPGYIGNGYDFSVDGTFDSAILTFEFDKSLLDNPDFVPAIYYYNEENQLLEELESQTINGNSVSVKLSHFSKYILLNKTEFDKVWLNDIKPPSSNPVSNMDIVFTLDISSSMNTNDPTYIRKTLTNEFISKLGDKDRAAVVLFKKISTYLNNGNFAETVDEKLKLMDEVDNVYNDPGTSNDGTNGSLGLYKSIEMFENSEAEYKYILFLSDGQDTRTSYQYSYIIELAKKNNITIHTIGLGNKISETTLKKIASETGGNYYHAEEDNNLSDSFDGIKGETIDLITDSNNDGISDYYTKMIFDGKLINGNGKVINKSEIFGSYTYEQISGVNGYLYKDIDKDGLKNGQEISIRYQNGKVYCTFKSSPVKVDSDYDGINDAEDKRPLIWDLVEADGFYERDRYLMQAAKLAYFKTDAYKNKQVSQVNLNTEEKRLVGLLSDWEIIATNDSYKSNSSQSKKDFGFGAVAIKKNNCVIIAFEGSGMEDSAFDWIMTDGGNVAMGGESVQLLEAYKFTAQVLTSSKFTKGCDLYITGHSLGAWLANKVSGVILNPTISNITNQIYNSSLNTAIGYARISADKIKSNDSLKKCVTFAAPGFTKDTWIEVSSDKLSKIYGYKYWRDPVSSFELTGKRFGKSRWSKNGVPIVCHALNTYNDSWYTVFHSGNTSKYTDTVHRK